MAPGEGLGEQWLSLKLSGSPWPACLMLILIFRFDSTKRQLIIQFFIIYQRKRIDL